MLRKSFALTCFAAATTALGLAASLAPAQLAGGQNAPWTHLADLHLDVVPRTRDEAARIAAVTSAPSEFTKPLAFEENAGGATTVRPRVDADAFSQPFATLDLDQELDFRVGNGLFKRLWVSAPSSTIASDGLGPLYNARSCQRCHLKNGRGHPPDPEGNSAVSMLLRVSVPSVPQDWMLQIPGYHATAVDPNYGAQLHDLSLPGIAAEYRLGITYEEFDVVLSDGETVSLRRPTYSTMNLGYGPLHPDAMLSPRVAPQMIGMGLLEAIPTADILARADPEDLDGDGISGRPNVVWSVEYNQPMLGRFGWKAVVPTVREQTAGAFFGDIGISTPLFPMHYGDCTPNQPVCRANFDGGNPEQSGFEVDDIALELVTFYTQTLAVPVRRGVSDRQVLRGREVFHTAGCAACHQPSYVTHRLVGDSAQSFQLIWPYTDMLLHDMGEGLADHRPEGRATGREWRTAPLWGIGRTQDVSGHTYFLHDGRARSLLEAILWHGGEAQTARDHVVTLPSDDRAALLTFLESL